MRKSLKWHTKYIAGTASVVNIGETARPLGTRVKEHRKEVESITGAFTIAEKTKAAGITNMSAITDHECNKNDVTDSNSV